MLRLRCTQLEQELNKARQELEAAQCSVEEGRSTIRQLASKAEIYRRNSEQIEGIYEKQLDIRNELITSRHYRQLQESGLRLSFQGRESLRASKLRSLHE